MKSKVSLIYCDEYNYDKVKDSIKKSIVNLGGLEKYISKGDKVLLKINLLMKKTPEEATTTHPVFVHALADILVEYGATVVIGDSPGGPFNSTIVNPIYKASGMLDILDKPQITLNYNFNSAERENPKGRILKQMTVVDMLNDVDKVISVSKLKTHGMMTFTGAVKNLFGIIPGVLKAQYHLNMSDRNDFANVLIDICLCANPVLSFMDGIVGMEGAGPSSGTPRALNAVIASESPYHLDKIACQIISLPFDKVPTINHSIKRNLVSSDLSDIELLGDSIEKFIVDDFLIPNTAEINPLKGKMPGFIYNFINRTIRSRPVVDKSLCIGCRDCAKNCPAKVIDMVDNKANINLVDCIRCFCCQELCPKKAIYIKVPFVLNLITGGKK